MKLPEVLYFIFILNLKIQFKKGLNIHGTLLNVMWQPAWEGAWEENGYMYMYGWVPLLSTWNYYNIVNQLYSNIKFKSESVSRSVVSNSLWPHGLQHARPLCPPSPRVWPSSCSLHWWCRPAILSSDALFSFCIWSSPASGTFPVQFTSVTQLCLTLCDPMDCSTPDFPVHHQLPEFTQTRVCWVCDAMQPSHPLSPSPPAFNLSQHQGLFKWVSSLHQVAKVLGFQLQHQSFQWRKWQPTLVPLPGKSHGQRSLVAYSPWGRKE